MSKLLFILLLLGNFIFPGCLGCEDLSAHQKELYYSNEITIDETDFGLSFINYKIYRGYKKIDIFEFLEIAKYSNKKHIQGIRNQKRYNRLLNRFLLEATLIGGSMYLDEQESLDFFYSLPYDVRATINWFLLIDTPITIIRLAVNSKKYKYNFTINKARELANKYNRNLFKHIISND